jgi:4-amino-4-deoxy-L-arabinose transferase-like glycosyltransferase
LSYKKKIVLLILLATLVRVAIATSVELGNDEVYYRMYAQYLQWNYFDHPPIVGWLIRFTTANLYLDTALFIRLGAILSAAITTWLFFLCGKKIANEHTGFLAAIIYTATIYGSIISGTFILPDSPQMVFWLLALYLLLNITQYKHINYTKKRGVFLLGIVIGLGMLCKVHTVFLWVGFMLFIVLQNREWLKQPVLYFSILITLSFFYPVIQWNIKNHFVTYLYHSKRVDIASSGLNVNDFASFFIGQIFYCNPILFFFFIKGVSEALKNNLPVLSSQKSILLLCSLPLILIALFVSLFKNVLPHWTGPAYSGIILLTACYFAKQKAKANNDKLYIPVGLKSSLILILTVIVLGVTFINHYPGTLGKKDDLLLGDGDFTLDMYGWKDVKKQMGLIFTEDIKKGVMKPNATILSNKWFPASHLDFYIAMPLKMNLLALGDTNDIHQYAWINAKRNKLIAGDDAYCITPSNNYFDVVERYKNKFAIISPPQIVVQYRSGLVCRKFYLWRLKNYLL